MTIRRDKKVGNINVHLAADVELAVRRLAEQCGMSASEYLHSIIETHLSEKKQEFRLLREIFECDGSLSSSSSQQTQ